MATVTGLTAERMIEMEGNTVIDGNVVGNDLILVTRDGTQINAGNVRGPTGAAGPAGSGFIICTSATRPVLTPGDEGKAIYETDTDLVRIWTGTRWKLQEQITCTSATRPAGLVAADEGVKIYETDTNIEYVWTGTSYLPTTAFTASFANATARNTAIPTPTVGMQSYLIDQKELYVYNGAWVSTMLPKLLSVHTSTADGSATSATRVTLPGTSKSVTFGPGNRYIQVHYTARFNGSAVNVVGRTQAAVAGQEIASVQWTTALAGAGYWEMGSASAFIEVSEGTHTCSMTVLRVSGSGTAVSMAGNEMVIIDWGPAPGTTRPAPIPPFPIIGQTEAS